MRCRLREASQAFVGAPEGEALRNGVRRAGFSRGHAVEGAEQLRAKYGVGAAGREEVLHVLVEVTP